MFAQRTWLRALLLLGLSGSASSCCFGGTGSIGSVPQTPPDPSIDALWLCTSIADIRCPAHAATLPSTTPMVFVSFRTHDVQRFVRPAALVVYAGAPRRELARGAVPAASAPTPGPGQIATWRFAEDITPPSAGWPVDGPVGVELVDANGVIAASTQVTFTGPRTPTRPVGVLAVCRTDQLIDREHPNCPTTNATLVLDPAQAVWVTYSTIDPALSGFEFVIEEQGRRGWSELDTERIAPSDLGPDEIRTVFGTYAMNQAAFAAGDVLRVRLLSGPTEVATATFTLQAP